MVAIFQAVVALYAAETSYLAALSPEKRAEYLARQRQRRELERLDGSPEVQLARECIANEGLSGESAERLLSFARDLARRRES